MPKNNQPKVSLVVLSWNTLDDTKECIKSLAKLDYGNFEIIVVDNGSTDGSKEYLRSLGKKIKLIDLEKNTGFTGGQIEAFRVARGKYIALVNSDAVVAKDWAAVLVDIMEGDDKAAAVGGKSFKYGPKQPAYNTENEFYSYQVVDPKRGYPETLTQGPRQAEVNSISGAGVMIRKSAAIKCGYFDNRFFAYYEETDLFARFKRAGFKIVYSPKAHIWHKIGASSSGKPLFYIKQMERNRYLYALKNFDLKYIPYFSYDYWAKFTKAAYRKVRKRSDIEQQARFEAGLWNIKELPRSLFYRAKTRKLGKTYSSLLKKDANDDVTIVIPCYNYQDYVSEAIESALNQTVKPARIITINDGSTDNSLKILQKYSTEVEIVDQKNKGIIKTKNLGLSMVNTKWVIFLDADDVMPEEYLEELLWAARNKEADVFYTDMKHFGAREELLRFKKFSSYRLREGNFIHNSALIRTDKIKAIKGYKNEMKGGYEDWEMYISMYEDGARFRHVKETTFLYRQHEAAASRNEEAYRKAKQLTLKVKKLHPDLFGVSTFAYVKSRGIVRYVLDLSKSFIKNPFRTTLHFAKKIPRTRQDLVYKTRFLTRLPIRPRDIKHRFGIYRYKTRAFMDKNVYDKSRFLGRVRGFFRKLKKGDLKGIKSKFFKK